MTLTAADAMRLAIDVSTAARGLSTPNPPVGAVVLDAGGNVVGTGHTREAGGPHAEVVALAAAGERARGGTAVVTLEPCAHHGRTPPCADALRAAGIAAVHYAIADPNQQAAGGGEALRRSGISVTPGTGAAEAAAGPLRAWLHRQRTGRPLVTLKCATTLDGRIAAADGTSRWITGPEARAHVHVERSRVDAIVVGTGTVAADDPRLTARPDEAAAPTQPLRVVVGLRDIPTDAAIRGGRGEFLHVRGHDPEAVLAAIDGPAGRPGACEVQIEGGAVLAGVFLAAGLVDRVRVYVAPLLLGAGPAAIGPAGVATLAAAHRLRPTATRHLGPDLLLEYDVAT